MLPELTLGACGHLVPVDLPPNALLQNGPYRGLPSRVCNACLDAARAHQVPRVERKVVDSPTSAGPVLDTVPVPVDDLYREYYMAGRHTAHEGKARTALTGFHHRSSEMRAYYRGYDDEMRNRSGPESG